MRTSSDAYAALRKRTGANGRTPWPWDLVVWAREEAVKVLEEEYEYLDSAIQVKLREWIVAKPGDRDEISDLREHLYRTKTWSTGPEGHRLSHSETKLRSWVQTSGVGSALLDEGVTDLASLERVCERARDGRGAGSRTSSSTSSSSTAQPQPLPNRGDAEQVLKVIADGRRRRERRRLGKAIGAKLDEWESATPEDGDGIAGLRAHLLGLGGLLAETQSSELALALLDDAVTDLATLERICGSARNDGGTGDGTRTSGFASSAARQMFSGKAGEQILKVIEDGRNSAAELVRLFLLFVLFILVRPMPDSNPRPLTSPARGCESVALARSALRRLGQATLDRRRTHAANAGS